MKQSLLLGLAIVPVALMAQNDTVPAPLPPVRAVPAIPPAMPLVPPGFPPLGKLPADTGRFRAERRAFVETVNGVRRIVVVTGDTNIVITKDRAGNSRVLMEVMGDTLRDRQPVTITTRNKVIRIYSDVKKAPTDSAQGAKRLRELRTERRNLFTYWSGVDLGVNTLMGPDGDADLSADAEFMEIDNARSRFLSINFLERKIEFGSHHVGLLTGLGLEFTNYHLKNNVLLSYNADSVYALRVESPEFRKNKLRQIGLRAPLMLEFNTKKSRLPATDGLASKKGWGFNRKGNFHIAMGVVGSWYFDTMYKQKYRLEGEDRKDRDKGDYHLLPYRAAASVRIGHGALNLFGEYALTPLFREGKGPEIVPLNIGLTIVGFN